MTPSDLKRHHETNNPDSYFFSRETMRFFGDTMSNYATSSRIYYMRGYDGSLTPCYRLTRKKPTRKGAPITSWFFAVNGFTRLHGEHALPYHELTPEDLRQLEGGEQKRAG
jgi:hypothetical protein